MTLGLLFWLMMVLWFVLWIVNFTGYVAGPYYGHVSNLFLFIMFLILGWGVFGAPIK